MGSIIEIDFETILSIWQYELWPERGSTIETHSAMLYQSDDLHTGMANFDYPAYYYGYIIDNEIIGVNSNHMGIDRLMRTRGLWVNKNYRGKGFGLQLLLRSIADAKKLGVDVWSYPRRISWTTYKAAGFVLTSDWTESETSDSNAYCYLKI